MLSNDFITGMTFGMVLMAATVIAGIMVATAVASLKNTKQPRKG